MTQKEIRKTAEGVRAWKHCIAAGSITPTESVYANIAEARDALPPNRPSLNALMWQQGSGGLRDSDMTQLCLLSKPFLMGSAVSISPEEWAGSEWLDGGVHQLPAPRQELRVELWGHLLQREYDFLHLRRGSLGRMEYNNPFTFPPTHNPHLIIPYIPAAGT